MNTLFHIHVIETHIQHKLWKRRKNGFALPHSVARVRTRTHARTHTCALTHTESVGCFTVFINAAAFIYGLQHLSEDGNGVLWVRGNPMPLLQIRDASTSSNRETSPRNLRRHHTVSPSKTWSYLKGRFILNPATDTHNSPWPPPPCVLESSNIFILSDVHLFSPFAPVFFPFIASIFFFPPHFLHPSTNAPKG